MLKTREQLIRLLTQAAELEHSICCMYLFAAFSMKRTPDEGLSWKQAESNRGWTATLLRIAREEMGHLGVVCNLLSAVGGTPHFWRPEFPHSGTLIAPEARFELRPFSLEEAERYILFERSEVAFEQEGGNDPVDGETHINGYRTVGELYREIKAAFGEMEEKDLFVGPPSAQMVIEYPTAVNLIRVSNRESAMRAIDMVVEEGKVGAGSHLERFIKMRDEFIMELECNPKFAPSRPVVYNPTSQGNRRPHCTVITDAKTLEVMALFNQAYTVMLLMLERMSTHADESPEELKTLQSIAYFPLMTMVLRPLAEMLTLLPAGPEYPEMVAGPGFELPHQVRLPFDKKAAWVRLVDSLRQLAAQCGDLVQRDVLGHRGTYLHENLRRIAMNFSRAMQS